MTMNADTPITIQSPGSDVADVETTWGSFVSANDADTVADVAEQIAADNYAEIGGGASPLVWIFA